jgi:hypothetical protein
MTKLEFIYKVPDILTHKVWGYSELEFIKFPKGDNRVGAQYRNENKTISYATIASSWDELYIMMLPHLQKEEHL